MSSGYGDFTLDDLVSDRVMELLRDSAEAAGESPPSIPMGAVLIVDVLHGDGARCLHSLRGSDTTAWTALGMVSAARAQWEDDVLSEDDG